jgi:hypothetical protein
MSGSKRCVKQASSPLLRPSAPLKSNVVPVEQYTNGGSDALRLEKRTRVEVFIPVREDDLAYEAVSRWIAEEFAFRRGGATATTAFIGFYASPSTGHIMRDQVQIIFTDVLVDNGDADARDELLTETRFAAHRH